MQKGPCTHAMNSRQRLRETFRYGKPDRVPYFEEAIREEVITCWRKQGLLRKPMREPLGNGTIRSRVARYFFMLFLYFFP